MQEEFSGQPPWMPHDARRALIEHVHIGALVAVHQDGNEVVVQQGGDLRIREALPAHDMAPVAGGVAEGEQDGLAVASASASASGPQTRQCTGLSACGCR